MSDIDYIFQNALKMSTDEESINYIFDNLSEYDEDSIIELWEEYLNNHPNKIKKMQTGLGMSQILPTNSVYKKGIFEI